MTSRTEVKWGRRYEIDRRSTMFGLVTSAAFHLTLIGSYLVVGTDVRQVGQGRNQWDHNTLSVEFKGRQSEAPKVGGGVTTPPPTGAGIIIPIPDINGLIKDFQNIIDPVVDQYFGGISDSGQEAGSYGPGTGGNEMTDGTTGSGLDIDEDPPVFDPNVARYPAVITKVSPDYPEIARKTGLEGKVSVLMLVNKHGKVQKASIAKSDNEVFDFNTLQAASKWVFTPGMSNAGPIPVWVTVPFEFRLNNK